MLSGVRMFARMLVRRTVAAEGHTAFLTCAKVDPGRAGLNAFFAFVSERLFYGLDRFDVLTGCGRHKFFGVETMG
jgi:hypothetical protein